MKIRDGFVSNSSSSSFCICGVYLSDGKLWNDWWGEDFNEASQFKKSSVEEKGLAVYEGGCGSGYVGLSIDDMKDDETLGDFKKRAKEKIAEVLGAEYAKETAICYGEISDN